MKSLAIMQLSMMLTGLIFIWIAFSKRTKDHPWYSNVNPVYIWKRKSWYTPVGYVIHVLGFCFFYFGLAISAINLL